MTQRDQAHITGRKSVYNQIRSPQKLQEGEIASNDRNLIKQKSVGALEAGQQPTLQTGAANQIHAEEPVENIKQRADELFNKKQYQHAMKFYEICLGKITAVTNVELNEDPYIMNLAIQTYMGICDSALHLNLWGHLSHFASQCISIDSDNTS